MPSCKVIHYVAAPKPHLQTSSAFTSDLGKYVYKQSMESCRVWI